jgi:hypothetical protein
MISRGNESTIRNVVLVKYVPGSGQCAVHVAYRQLCYAYACRPRVLCTQVSGIAPTRSCTRSALTDADAREHNGTWGSQTSRESPQGYWALRSQSAVKLTEL